MFAKLKSFIATKTVSAPGESIKLKRQGDAYLNQDRLDDAAEYYRRAISIDPDYFEACVGLGFALSEQKQYGEAEQCLHQALSIDSNNADAHYILGTISKNRNDHASAIEHFTNAIDIRLLFEFAHRDLFDVLFHSGQIDRAREVIERAITVFPESAEFRFYLANLYSHEKEYEKSIACYEKALLMQPDSVASHINLASVLFKAGQYDEAVASYQKALSFEPHAFDAHVGLGAVSEKMGRLHIAIDCYEYAAILKPEDPATQVSLGNVLETNGKMNDAIKCYRRAIELNREYALAHQSLGNLLLSQGESQEAQTCFEEVVRLEPDSPVKHIAAALSGRITDRAPNDYVEKLFDEYADKFDSHLVKTLNYSVPESLAALLKPYHDAAGEKWIILDLGCGTGLFGVAVAPFARRLVGVDLSAKMLEKAGNLNLYHRLEREDLLKMMREEPPSSYDVVSAADVFVYIGILDELVKEAKRLLRSGGIFAFSVESLEALSDAVKLSELPDFQLNVTGRYAHSIRYLTRLARDNGFDVLTTAEAQSRLDKGNSVKGYLTVWQCPLT